MTTEPAQLPHSSEPEEVDELLVAGLPAGIWRATLRRVDRRSSVDEATGEVRVLLGWHWDVELGDDGDEPTPYRQTTSTANGPRSRFASIVAALRPDLASPGSKLRPSVDLYGRSALLTVEIVEGATRVVAVSPERAKGSRA